MSCRDISLFVASAVSLAAAVYYFVRDEERADHHRSSSSKRGLPSNSRRTPPVLRRGVDDREAGDFIVSPQLDEETRVAKVSDMASTTIRDASSLPVHHHPRRDIVPSSAVASLSQRGSLDNAAAASKNNISPSRCRSRSASDAVVSTPMPPRFSSVAETTRDQTSSAPSPSQETHRSPLSQAASVNTLAGTTKTTTVCDTLSSTNSTTAPLQVQDTVSSSMTTPVRGVARDDESFPVKADVAAAKPQQQRRRVSLRTDLNIEWSA